MTTLVHCDCLVALTDRMLQSKLAAPAPCILAGCFLGLLSITRLIAISFGHVNGQIFPPVSQATRLAPEYYIWVLGVLAVLFGAMLPMAVLVFRALLPSRGDHDAVGVECYCGCCMPPAVLTAYLSACLFLIGLAAIPLQEDIYDVEANPDLLNVQSILHLTCAAFFFGIMNVTGWVIVAWQCCGRCCPSNPSFGRRIGIPSLGLKVLFATLGLFPQIIGYPLLYAYLTVFYGSDFVAAELWYNEGGAYQRTLVAMTVFFVATFWFEIKAFQEEAAQLETRSLAVGSPVQLNAALPA